MGMIQDAVDSIETWFENILKDGIKSNFENITSFLGDTFDQAGSGSSIVSEFMTTHPAEFTGVSGGTGSGVYVWSTIEKVCNNAVVPIAGFILTVILLTDLFSMVIRGNNFKDFDDSIFIKWIIKALCGVLLVSNVYYIASGLFAFGTSVVSNGLGTLFGGGALGAVALQDTALDGYGIGTLISVLLISLIVYLCTFLLMAVIIITLASRIIEVFMYLGISPIPMATMMHSGEWSGIGKNWVKQLLALSFQAFFIVIALGVFKTLFVNTIAQINSGSEDIIMQMATLLGYTAALIFTMLRTGAISKSVFNAH